MRRLTVAKTQGHEEEVKCYANIHLTPAEFGFWEVCRSLTYKFNYHLIFDGRDMAENFDKTGKDVAYRLAKKLCKKGWFVCTQKAKRGKGEKYVSAEYNVLSHDEWAKKHDKKHCRKPHVSPVAEMRTAIETNPEHQSRKREQSSRGNANDPVAETRHSTEYPSLLKTKASEELRGNAKLTPFLKEFEGRQDALCDSENMPPVAETRTVKKSPVAETRTDEPFKELSVSQIVGLLPRTEGMKLYHKYDKGREYNQHRAEIIAAVLEHQKTQEAAQ
jgi:hypothetical protein